MPPKRKSTFADLTPPEEEPKVAKRARRASRAATAALDSPHDTSKKTIGTTQASSRASTRSARVKGNADLVPDVESSPFIAPKSKRKARDHTVLAAVDDHPPIFNQLPLELLQHIVLYLDPHTYLTVKFVCKAFNTSTKKSDGTELVKHKILKRQPPDHSKPYGVYYSYNNMEPQLALTMAAIEAGLCSDIPRPKLICSKCGHYNTKAVRGFCDEEFEQGNAKRVCNICLPYMKDSLRRNALTIRGKPYFLCLCCRRIQRKEIGFTRAEIGTGFHGPYLEIVLKDTRLVKQKSKDRICGQCLKDVARKAMTTWVQNWGKPRPKGQSKGKGKGRGNKRRRADSEDEDGPEENEDQEEDEDEDDEDAEDGQDNDESESESEDEREEDED